MARQLCLDAKSIEIPELFASSEGSLSSKYIHGTRQLCLDAKSIENPGFFASSEGTLSAKHYHGSQRLCLDAQQTERTLAYSFTIALTSFECIDFVFFPSAVVPNAST